MFDTVTLLSLNAEWLLTANLLLSCLLLLWVLRYRQLYRSFKKEADQHSTSLDELNEGFYRASIDGKITNVNSAFAEMLGFNSREEFLAGNKDVANEWYLEPNRREIFSQLLNANGSVHNFVSEAKNIKTKETIWVSENAHIVNSEENGKATHYEGSMLNITDAVLRVKLEDRIEKLSMNLPGGLFQMASDDAGTITIPYASQGFHDLLGVENNTSPELKDLFAQIHPDFRKRFNDSMKRSLENNSCWNVDFRVSNHKDTETWIGLVATPEQLEDGTTIFHGHINDISERKENEGKVAYYAYYDPLTRLPNRTFFTHQLSSALISSKRSGKFGALLFLDIDNFKNLNDNHGHAVGDLLLQQVADRLSATVRANDTVSRFGGDEFVILLEGVGETTKEAEINASLVARKIISEFDAGFNLDGLLQESSPSIGIVTFSSDRISCDSLIKNADNAMYEAKKQGRKKFVLFANEETATNCSNQLLQKDLADALKADELSLYFHPQIDQNGKIYGAEALLRWQHSKHGLLIPKDILPLADSSGLNNDLNEFVLRNAIANLAKWRSNNCDTNLRLAINVSAQQLRQASFKSQLVKVTEEHKVPLELLTLEVTEYTLRRDIKAMAESMNAIKTLGVKISLDDYGIGNSSLLQLSALPFDEVKIDGTFIRLLGDDEANQRLVEAILATANAMNIDIVAEHVNSGFQERFLLARGCRKFQGYSYSKPLPDEDFQNFLMRDEEVRLCG